MLPFISRRSAVHSTKGIVSSSQPLASQAGIKILEQGGNAADAAVAVAAALNVTEPTSTGIGGDAFCLFYNSKTKRVHALNGSGRTGSKVLPLDKLRAEIGLKEGENGRIPIPSVHSVTIPGAAAAWVDTVEKFGSGQVSLEQVLTPAILLAENGFQVSEVTSDYWQRSASFLKQQSPNGFEMLKKDPKAPDGYRGPKSGELMKNPTLANTFKLLGKSGKKGFYEGFVAEALIKVTSELGGRLVLDDLKAHGEMGSEEVDAISIKYQGQNVNSQKGGLQVWEHPPNGQGIVALIALGILEELEKDGKIPKWESRDHNSVQHLHACIEALRIAFADANWWIADPNVSKVPTKELLSPAYLAERAKLFDPKRATTGLAHGSPAHNHCDTVYFAVTDIHGNGASFINSNFAGFGTGIVPKGCGFTLQNRGSNFSLKEGHPNVFAPKKRPYHTIIPGLITNPDDGSLNSVYGVMGGFMQPQGHVQVLLNSFVFGMNPQEAIDAPRFCLGGGMLDGSPDLVHLEDGISPEVGKELENLGHNITFVKGISRGLFGRGQLIQASFEGGQLIYSAGSDGRADGAAIPLI